MDVRAWAPMTSLIGEAEVLKTDTRGRVRVPVERREALLDEFEKSGMSGAKFARLAGEDVFTRLPSTTNWQIEDITPKAWAKQQNRSDLPAAAWIRPKGFQQTQPQLISGSLGVV